MAKRSPIAGYNHNVRFRGLIFHVQTEDSGLASPHLFTHLFYGGVIISTRKLVYDAGSAEDAIKGLMQAQHKVVMKDLKRGAFDDKIDLYLAGNEELLPRGPDSVGSDVAGMAATAAARASANLVVPDAVVPDVAVPDVAVPDAAVPEVMVAADDTLAVPTELPREPSVRAQTDIDEIAMLAAMDAAVEAESAAPLPISLPIKPRTQTADRKSAPTKVRSSLSSEPFPPPAPTREDLDPPTLTDHAAASVAAALADVNATRQDIAGFQLDDDEVIPLEGGRIVDDASAAPSAPIHLTQRRVTGSGAAVPPLPPSARPSMRAPARDEVEASARFVPEPAHERAGQYAQHMRPSQRVNVVDQAKAERELSGPTPVVPPTTPRSLTPSVPPLPRSLTPSVPPLPRSLTPSVPLAHGAPAPSAGIPRPRAPEPSARPVERPRTPTPTRVSGGAPPARPSQGGSSGVVMSRPAVIVGAPPRPIAPPRVRQAREDEGRGFGQGLISEKSLDEVILAYLSEDAEDK